MKSFLCDSYIRSYRRYHDFPIEKLPFPVSASGGESYPTSHTCSVFKVYVFDSGNYRTRKLESCHTAVITNSEFKSNTFDNFSHE